MIVKELKIENYLCYYETKFFEFSDGLNIILGENNEGKTKLFEAVDWLFNGQNKNLEELVSAKKLAETQVGESFRVRVSMTVEHYGEKCIFIKSFLATKEMGNKCITSNYSLEGIKENSYGERSQVDGQGLLDRVFPFQIREYSMFKGESALNIFDNENALINLINLFSDAKHYSKYAETGEDLLKNANRAVEQSTRQNRDNAIAYNKLENEIAKLEKEKAKYIDNINDAEDELRKIEKNLQEVEMYVDNAETLETLNNRIELLKEKIKKQEILIDENYTTSLFDEFWILANFEPFHKEFANKITVSSRKRRELQSEFDKQKGILEGERKAKLELLNDALPLPVSVPSKSHMEEMLSDEICKVCNREAKKGSEAYQFMMNRLDNYIKSQIVQETDQEPDPALFQYEHIAKLEYLSNRHEDNLKNIRLIKNNIKELFEFNNKRRIEIEELNDKLMTEIAERERIIGNSKIAEEKLINNLKNYNAWQDDKNNKLKDIRDYENDLKPIELSLTAKKEDKDKIDTSSANSFLIKTRDILRDIETIFNETKEKKFDEFIEKLALQSNEYLNQINVEAFTGKIKFTKKKYSKDRVKIDVSLYEKGGRHFNPGTAVETSMNISILLAISALAFEVRDETYPMIFDAPTSSFGETKTGDFLNLIYNTSNQKIVLLKNFIGSEKNEDGMIKDLFIKDEFSSIKRNKAFWVKLERPFVKDDLKTISTNVISL